MHPLTQGICRFLYKGQGSPGCHARGGMEACLAQYLERALSRDDRDTIDTAKGT